MGPLDEVLTQAEVKLIQERHETSEPLTHHQPPNSITKSMLSPEWLIQTPQGSHQGLPPVEVLIHQVVWYRYIEFPYHRNNLLLLLGKFPH